MADTISVARYRSSPTSDPRLDDAVDQITFNANFSFEPEPVCVSGPMWGTFVIINEGGSWDGTWTGVREKNGFSYFHYIGTGTDGYEGLKLRLWGERLDPDPKMIVNALGQLEDGRHFNLHITWVHDEVQAIQIQIK